MTSFLKTMIKTHKHADSMDNDTRNLLLSNAVSSVVPDTSLREVMTAFALYHMKNPVPENILEDLKQKIFKVCSFDGSDPSNEAPSMETIALLPVNQDISLFELSQKLSNGQLKRFIDETFNTDSLDYMTDQIQRPEKHAQGFFQKALIQMTLGVARRVDGPLLDKLILEQMQFNWTDDGATNKKFETFLTAREIERKTKEQTSDTPKTKMEM